MISVKIFLIICIILSLILTFFSIMLLTALVTDKQNFLFTKIISNKMADNTIFKTGIGILTGSSLSLAISLFLFYRNYDCGFINSCNSDEKRKPEIYHRNIKNNIAGEFLEWIITALVLFLTVGLSMFSIEFFHIIESDDNFNDNDELKLWIIFSLSLSIILVSSFILIYLLILKKPKDKKEKSEYPVEKSNNIKNDSKLLKSKNIKKINK